VCGWINNIWREETLAVLFRNEGFFTTCFFGNPTGWRFLAFLEMLIIEFISICPLIVFSFKTGIAFVIFLSSKQKPENNISKD
jgi:hypothetical protein